MTFEESNTIFELSVTADQTRGFRMYARIQNVLSSVLNQIETIADGLDALADIKPVEGESA